jgi:hypothetical protein
MATLFAIGGWIINEQKWATIKMVRRAKKPFCTLGHAHSYRFGSPRICTRARQSGVPPELAPPGRDWQSHVSRAPLLCEI